MRATIADNGNTRSSHYPSLHYPFAHLYEATLSRNYRQNLSALPMITSMYYKFASRKQFPSNTHVPFCPSPTLCLSCTCVSCHTFSPLVTSVNVQCIQGFLLFILSVIIIIIIIIIIISGVGLSPLGTVATSGLLYKSQLIDEGDCGAIGGMKIGRGNRSTRRKPYRGPLCPPQIPHDQTQARTQATAVGSQRLTA
jgi:hypothetical protein